MPSAIRILAVFLLIPVLIGCGGNSRPAGQLEAVDDSDNSNRQQRVPNRGATPAAVLERIRSLGGKCQTDQHGRVVGVNFHRCPLHDGDLEVLRETPDVRWLNLRGVSVVGGTLSTPGLQPLAALTGLRRLDLSSNRYFTGSLTVICQLPELEFLDARGTELHDDAMLSIGKLTRLRTLWVGTNQITEAGVRELYGCPLEHFDYWRRDREDSGLLGGFKKLKKWRVGFGEVRVDRLQEYAGMDRLENLWITCYGGECPQESIDALRSMTSLVSLQIACPPDKDCPLLAALDSLPELKMLRLTSIGDRGLDSLPRLPPLERLDLSLQTRVTASGLRSLQRLPSLRHLALCPEQTTARDLLAVAECEQLETLVFDVGRIDFHQNHLSGMARSWPGPPPAFRAMDLRPVLERTAIRRLDVDGLGFGDDLMSVAALASGLERLNLERLPVTDAGLLQLRHLEHLTWMEVSGTKITMPAAEDFQRQYARRCHFTDNWCCGCLALQPLDR